MSAMAVPQPAPEQPRRIKPSMEEIAIETIQWLSIDGYASSVMKMDRPVLNEFGRQLITPGAKRAEVYKWLIDQGVTLPDRNLDRFAQRFREVAEMIRGEWEDRIVQDYLDGELEAQGEELDELIRNRHRRLMAQFAVRLNAAEADPREMQLLTRAVDQIDGRAYDSAKLELARQAAEHRNAKLEAEVERLQLGLQEQRRRLAAAVDRAKAETTDAAEQQGGALDKDDVLAILDRVMKGEAA
ncbi:MAG: hypothetical protein AAF797_17845 [Planctomycetota bacterium]